ncbi:hypothetical protein Moror_4075 [Moniliophthora roreri MCA 2997]|uniref:Uncharacterized protein n=1 Tax=Moniliophthora roreri (strain MCA 2997) TaxID=1381753 RepID=V2YGD9_MONRO|nr:hypothetical protein Moror_4075 [Moniliophthora roreri MCA 2997]
MQASATRSVDGVIEERVKNKTDDEEIRRLRSFLSSLHDVVRRCLYEDPEVYLTPRPGSQSPTSFSVTSSSYSGAVKGEVPGETPMSRDVRGLLQEWSMLKGSRQRHNRVDEEHNSSQDPGSHSNLDILLSEFSSLIHALENDPATLRFVHALQGLEIHFQEYMAQFADTAGEIIHQGTSKAQDTFYTLWTDIIGFIIPRVLGSVLSSIFRAESGVPIPLPLPRIEVKSPDVEGVVDPRGMTVFLEQDEPDGYGSFEEEEYWWGRRASMISPDNSQSRSLSSSVSALSVNSDGQARGYREDDDASDGERGGTVADLLTPRSVVMNRWSETRVGFGVVGEAAEARVDERTPLLQNADTAQKPKTQVQTMDRMHVTIDGLLASTYHSHSTRRRVHTLELDNIAFYVKYTLLQILGYEDEGIANLDLDFAWSQNEDSGGAKIDMDLEVDFDSLNELRDLPLKIQARAIHVDLPASMISLAVRPTIVHSQRHPILTTLLVNPVLWVIYMASSYWVRSEIEMLLAEALRVGIEGSTKLVVDVWSLARHKAQARSDASETDSSMMMGDWYEALVDVLRKLGGTEEQPETEMDVSLKGVKMAIPRQNGDEGNVEVAVGPVPQLLPEHAEPELLTVDQAVDDVIKGVQEGTDKVVEDVRDNIEAGVAVVQQQSEAALEFVEGVAVGVNQAQLRKEVEKKQKRVRYSMVEPPRRREREGWRSAVFDI